VQVGSGSLNNYTNTSTNNQTFITNNAYYNSGWKYVYSDIAAMYDQKYQGGHAWHIAPSGTAGNAITFTQAMTLDASGLLTVGNTSPAGSSQITAYGASNGQIAVQNSTNWSRLLQNANNLYIDNGVGGSTGNTIFRGSSSTIELMRLDSSGNLLVGSTSSYRSGKLVVKAANETQTSTNANFQISTTDAQAANIGGSIGLGGQTGADEAPFAYISGRKENSISGNYAGYLAFATLDGGGGAVERARIDSSGNLGLGVTPSAWATVLPVLQVSNASFTGYNNQAILSSNYYYNAGNKYSASTYATQYSQTSGQHIWYTAPSGTAGNAITFTQAMTLDASGNLLVGTTSGNSRLGVTNNDTNPTVSSTNQATFTGGANFTVNGLRVTSGGDVAGNTTRLCIGVGSGSQVYLDSENVGGANSGSNLLIYTRTNGGGMGERARIDSSGNLGIGTSSPADKLEVYSTITARASSGTSALRLRNTTSDYQWQTVAGTNAVVLYDNAVGSGRVTLDSSGNVQVQAGAVVVYAPAPTSISSATTLTNASIQAQIINTTGTSYTVTMPIGTTLETLVSWTAVNLGHDFFIVNTASGTITLDATETGVTSVGSMSIPTGTSAQFRIRRTAANTFIVYRL
jgi:hypothetical protein